MKFQTIVTAVLRPKTMVNEKNTGRSCWKSVEKFTFRILIPQPYHFRQIM